MLAMAWREIARFVTVISALRKPVWLQAIYAVGSKMSRKAERIK